MKRVSGLGLLGLIASIWAFPALADYEAAAQYSAAHSGLSMVVIMDGEVVFEDYPNGGSADQANPLASGTKSFVGIMAAAAVQDGFFDLDDPVSETIIEWQQDDRASITIRQLLNMTDGLRRAGSFGRPPPYDRAAQLPLDQSVGEVFDYHAVPLQVFGRVMQLKLADLGELGMRQYLNQRVFGPIGMEIGRWRGDGEGNPLLSTGARVTARNWARFGEFVLAGGEWDGQALVDPTAFEEIFQGSEVNPVYGLTWWLIRDVDPAYAAATEPLSSATDFWTNRSIFPDDLVMAAGLGDQRLYVSRDRHLVVVRQAGNIGAAMRGRDSGWSDVEFWRLLEAAPGEIVIEAEAVVPAPAPVAASQPPAPQQPETPTPPSGNTGPTLPTFIAPPTRVPEVEPLEEPAAELLAEDVPPEEAVEEDEESGFIGPTF